MSSGVPSARASECTSNHTFENWAHTLKFRPQRFCQPRTEESLAAIVKEAKQAGRHVRTQGAGHSFSQLLATQDTLVSLDHLERPTTRNGRRVTVAGGMRLKRLVEVLAELGLGLENMGSITEQSIAGAISTGTHGTGLRLGAISTQIVGARLVTGTGDVRTITEQDARELSAVRIGIGALGIITETTLECVDHYQLEYTAYLTSFDEVIDKIDVLNQENVRVLFWWLVPSIGPRDRVIVITKNPIGHPPGILGSASEMVVPAIPGLRRPTLPQDAGDLQSMLVALFGGGSGPFKKIWHMTGDYNEILTIPLLPVFHRECEYAIPVSHTAAALKEFRRVVEEGDFALSLPVEVRFVAKDDILLSPANGRDVCYIGASTQTNATEVFERFEPIMKDYEGKPHWGKNFTLTQAEVVKMYPGTYDTFKQVRDELDPSGVFRNMLLDDLFP
jgi:FAD/FMN-containing dehydrogenase